MQAGAVMAARVKVSAEIGMWLWWGRAVLQNELGMSSGEEGRQKNPVIFFPHWTSLQFPTLSTTPKLDI